MARISSGPPAAPAAVRSREARSRRVARASSSTSSSNRQPSTTTSTGRRPSRSSAPTRPRDTRSVSWPGPKLGRRSGRCRPDARDGRRRRDPHGLAGPRSVIAASGRSPRSGRPCARRTPRRLCAKTAPCRRPVASPAMTPAATSAARWSASRRLASPSQCASTQSVEISPRANPSSRISARSNGSVVWIPVTTTSSSARRIRSMAAVRSVPTVMILAIIGS